MTGKILRSGTWVAVCDGHRALLLENKGDSEYPHLEVREHFEQNSARTSMQGSSSPGRTFSSVGGRRASVEQTDLHERDEREFLREFSECIDKYVRDHGIKSLMLVAPARALGMIRPALSVNAARALVAELDRDYTKMPLYEMEERLKS